MTNCALPVKNYSLTLVEISTNLWPVSENERRDQATKSSRYPLVVHKQQIAHPERWLTTESGQTDCLVKN